MLKKMALSGIANLFAEKMPFNKLIGMQVTHYDFDKVELRIKMEEKLIGNPFHNIRQALISIHNTYFKGVKGCLHKQIRFGDEVFYIFGKYKIIFYF